MLQPNFEWLEFQTPLNDSGRLDEHEVIIDGMRFWTSIFFLTDITQFLLAHAYVALTNDMLKAYKVAQVCIFLSGWLKEAYFLCISRTKCSPSQTMYRYCTKEDDRLTEGAYCSCTCRVWNLCMFFFNSLSCLVIMQCQFRTIRW